MDEKDLLQAYRNTVGCDPDTRDVGWRDRARGFVKAPRSHKLDTLSPDDAVLPPQGNIEAEQALLGAILINNAAFHRVSAFLLPEHFAEEVHGRIFAALARTIGAGRTASALTLKEEFDRDPALADLGGGAYLGRLVAGVLTVVNAEDFGRVIYDLWLRRRLWSLGDELRRAAAGDGVEGEISPDELVTKFSADLARFQSVSGGMTKREVAERVAESLKSEVEICPTAISTLDDAIGGGLICGHLYGIAARKKVGKTILLGTISHNINNAGVRHGFISLEMSPEQIERRNAAREGRFNSIKFLTRDKPNLTALAGEYAVNVPDFTIYEHAPGITLDGLRRVMARMVQRKARGIILDYWQLVGGARRGENTTEHLGNVAQFLSDFARRENVWVLTAAQVNQEGNTRGGEGLKLACDMYLTLHREKDEPGAWLEMEESRFTAYVNVGSEVSPGLWLWKHGPFFSDNPPPLPAQPSPSWGAFAAE